MAILDTSSNIFHELERICLREESLKYFNINAHGCHFGCMFPIFLQTKDLLTKVLVFHMQFELNLTSIFGEVI